MCYLNHRVLAKGRMGQLDNNIYSKHKQLLIKDIIFNERNNESTKMHVDKVR